MLYNWSCNSNTIAIKPFVWCNKQLENVNIAFNFKRKFISTLQFLHRMWTFKLLFLCIVILLNNTFCYDSESFETKRVEVTPFYDTIIYSDIADIINDFENNGNIPYDTLLNSESESEDNIEDLLNEYQQYLDKAHKERITYLERKTKNKVPPLRRDKYPKIKATSGTKYNDLYNSNNYYNPHTMKFSRTSFNNPLDVYIPLNSKGRFIDKGEITTVVPKMNHDELSPFDKIIFNEKKFKVPTLMHKPTFETIKSSCYCKNNQIPCECNCEKCIMPFETPPRNHVSYSPYEGKSVLPSLFYENSGKEHLIEDIADVFDNTLNIRVKVELQLPRTQEVIGKYFKLYNHDKTLERDDYNSKEFSSAINIPLPYFNFPIPMNVFDLKKTLKYTQHDKTPIHKITIHKKKKAKVNNNNKRHRKKVITFHNIKLEPQQVFLNHFANKNLSNSFTKDNFTNVMLSNNSEINLMQNSLNHTIHNKTVDVFNKTQPEESIYVMVNISSGNDNGTDDNHKLENSIETDYIKTVPNETTKLPKNMREKRSTNNDTKYIDTLTKHDSIVKAVNTSPPKFNANIKKGNNNFKKSEKSIFTDTELLYWPNSQSHNYTHSKNITSIILDNEHKKTKLNMSKETIRHNHTRALEEAIFGEVDWDDIDAVAPAFMSFVGKYIRGILTFCSHSVCHSMNCARNTCIHRVCLPVERLNNREHCIGSDKTDSIASLESIMDLPSNIAFEIVDILQNKMLGKLFGKATLCINAKCITFIASKKNFIKYRCSIKELNTIGHCSYTENVKIM